MTKKRKHLLVLTDRQLQIALHAIRGEIEDYCASGEDHPGGVKVSESLLRQQAEGLNMSEQTWAMEEIVRLGRRK